MLSRDEIFGHMKAALEAEAERNPRMQPDPGTLILLRVMADGLERCFKQIPTASPEAVAMSIMQTIIQSAHQPGGNNGPQAVQ